MNYKTISKLELEKQNFEYRFNFGYSPVYINDIKGEGLILDRIKENNDVFTIYLRYSTRKVEQK